MSAPGWNRRSEDSSQLSAASKPTYGKRGTSLTGGCPGGTPAQRQGLQRASRPYCRGVPGSPQVEGRRAYSKATSHPHREIGSELASCKAAKRAPVQQTRPSICARVLRWQLPVAFGGAGSGQRGRRQPPMCSVRFSRRMGMPADCDALDLCRTF